MLFYRKIFRSMRTIFYYEIYNSNSESQITFHVDKRLKENKYYIKLTQDKLHINHIKLILDKISNYKK